MKQIAILAAASTIAIVASGQASAQEQNEPDQVKKLDQVTVTAVKREQDLNDVPVSVTAYTADIRQELALESLSDFARFTPSLAFSAGDDRVFIRGVGRQTNTNGSDPGIATYSDGIYDSSTSAVSRSDFFVERVEVLRGPQVATRSGALSMSFRRGRRISSLRMRDLRSATSIQRRLRPAYPAL